MKKVVTDKQKIEEVLTRSVEEVLPTREGLRELLLSGRRLRIYIGTDATGTSLHLGHATNYMILEKFRQLGHEVVFLIGDFTARIGDPTDKGDIARKQLTRGEVLHNVKTWIDQIRPVIDVDNKDNPVKILYNNDWLAALTLENVLNLASNFTVQQVLERDMFQERIKKEKPLYLHELLYPLMQGYDSVAMDVDVEMCGMDQKFNALAGRTLLRKLKNKEKFVFITTLLENPKTGEKMMSKSLGTGVFLDADGDKMFGGIMSQPDENMRQLFIDCTRLDMVEIESILQEKNPRDSKIRLATEIVTMYHGRDVAKVAKENFIKTFSEGGVPEDINEFLVVPGVFLKDALLEHKLVSSGSDFRRLVDERAVSVNNNKIEDPKIIISENSVVRVGKRRFIKFIIA
ncbi:MAG: tyrosine--tRNA ligase [Candidatus Vogelbacteria bacterium]|nr:tyrosine--tRNA ligase [Candidatus Vogelbacteria bacterium]